MPFLFIDLVFILILYFVLTGPKLFYSGTQKNQSIDFAFFVIKKSNINFRLKDHLRLLLRGFSL